MSLVRPSEKLESQFNYNWLQLGTFQLEIYKFFTSIDAAVLPIHSKTVEIFSFDIGVKVEFIESWKSNLTNYFFSSTSVVKKFDIRNFSWYSNCRKSEWVEYSKHKTQPGSWK